MSRYLKVRARCKYLTARGLVGIYCQWRNDLSRKTYGIDMWIYKVKHNHSGCAHLCTLVSRYRMCASAHLTDRTTTELAWDVKSAMHCFVIVCNANISRVLH